MNYTDQQLKEALAKMLPEKIETVRCIERCYYGKGIEVVGTLFRWRDRLGRYYVESTEWLYVCWLAEETLTENERIDKYCKYWWALFDTTGAKYSGDYEWFYLAHATWQQRATGAKARSAADRQDR